jgi:copper chaperone CopZ
MLRYHVEGMTCGHCVQTVTKAVKGLDANAHVDVDLASKMVQVETTAQAERVAAAISDAGYAPSPQA